MAPRLAILSPPSDLDACVCCACFWCCQVRRSKLHQWTYEITHGANVHARHVDCSLHKWMRERLTHQVHSVAGHREVYNLLVAHGYASCEPFEEPWCESTEVWGSDEYDTDHEIREVLQAHRGQHQATDSDSSDD